MTRASFNIGAIRMDSSTSKRSLLVAVLGSEQGHIDKTLAKSHSCEIESFCLSSLKILILIVTCFTRIHRTTKPYCAGTVHARSHEQVLAMLRQLITLRKVSARALWLIMAAASQNRSASVFINVLIGPLPNVADEIHYSKRARALRMR